MRKVQRAWCGGGLVVEVEVAVLLKLDSSPSRVVEHNPAGEERGGVGGGCLLAHALKQNQALHVLYRGVLYRSLPRLRLRFKNILLGPEWLAAVS